MKRFAILAQGLSLLVFLTGCPFESRVPLGRPSPGSIDTRLVGFWSGTDLKGGDSLDILILPFNDAEYFVEVVENDESRDRYRAYAIPVAGESVLQINEVIADGESESFVLARYGFTDDRELHVRFIGDRIVPKALDSDPAGLLDFLALHLGDPELDDEDVELVLRPEASDE